MTFFLIVTKLLNDSVSVQNKIAIQVKMFWRVISVNHFLWHSRVWGVSRLSSRRTLQKPEEPAWRVHLMSNLNCAIWVREVPVLLTTSISCVREVKQSNRQGQIVMRTSLTQVTTGELIRQTHRWRLKPFVAPWQLGTSGGVVESRRWRQTGWRKLPRAPLYPRQSDCL